MTYELHCTTGNGIKIFPQRDRWGADASFDHLWANRTNDGITEIEMRDEKNLVVRIKPDGRDR